MKILGIVIVTNKTWRANQEAHKKRLRAEILRGATKFSKLRMANKRLVELGGKPVE